MVVGSAVLLFVALFDLAGVQYGLLGIAGLLKDGNVPRSTSIFASAGIATMFGSLLGTSPIIIASENSAGIIEGAKTGLMAVVVAILFFFSAFLGPLLSAVPHVATAVPLVLIGAFMMAPCRSIDWDNLRVAIPSFLTMTVVPFTYSIHTGIIAGILMDGFLTMFSKPLKEPKPLKEEPIMAIDAPTKVDCVVTNDLARTSSPACLSRRFSTPHMTLAASACNDTKVDDARKLLEKLCYAPPSAPQSPAMHGRDPGEEVAAEQALKKALEKFVEAH
uniref:SLC26A/SulP transporter domain-containing protein n=1 Tax=Zooxanthella nutricula TaxID=1333877 RepID=A0A7S2J814_9DINO